MIWYHVNYPLDGRFYKVIQTTRQIDKIKLNTEWLVWGKSYKYVATKISRNPV